MSSKPERFTVAEALADPSLYAGREIVFDDGGAYALIPDWGNVMIPTGQMEVHSVTAFSNSGTYIHTSEQLGARMVPSGAIMRAVGQSLLTADSVDALVFAQRLRAGKYINLVGTDPEVFAETAKGELIPAFEFLPSKAKADVGQGYWDGYQAEWSTTPQKCLEINVDFVRKGLVDIASRLKDGERLSVKTTFDIPPERLQNDPRKYVKFGCVPSLSAYGETFPETDPASIPFRSSGGHMHFSWGYHASCIPTVVKELDRVLGVISVSLFQKYDDPRRRIVYGRAGEYRTPSYGFEYRTLSSAWTIHPAMCMFVFELARRVLGQVRPIGPVSPDNAEVRSFPRWNASEEEVRKCINTCDVALAHEIMSRNMETLDAIILSMPGVAPGGHDTFRDGWKNVIFRGVHTVLREPERYSSWWKKPVSDKNANGKHTDWNTLARDVNFSCASSQLLTTDFID